MNAGSRRNAATRARATKWSFHAPFPGCEAPRLRAELAARFPPGIGPFPLFPPSHFERVSARDRPRSLNLSGFGAHECSRRWCRWSCKKCKVRKSNPPTICVMVAPPKCRNDLGNRFPPCSSIVFTGCRISTSTQIAWRDLDFEVGEIAIRGDPEVGTQNSAIRRVPMIPQARKLFERMQRVSAERRSCRTLRELRTTMRLVLQAVLRRNGWWSYRMGLGATAGTGDVCRGCVAGAAALSTNLENSLCIHSTFSF